MATPRSFALSWFLIVLAAGMVTGGCIENEIPLPPPPPPPAPAPQQAPPDAGQAQPPAPPATRVTVETLVIVPRLDAASQAVRDAVEGVHGDIVNERTSGSDDARDGLLEVRIPEKELPAFRRAIGKLGETASIVGKVDDVTEQHTVIEARLDKARAEEARLLELRKASPFDPALEKPLAEVREKLESMEARASVLQAHDANATVKVQLSARYTARTLNPLARLREAGVAGLLMTSSLLVSLGVVVVSAAPLLIVAIVFVYALYRLAHPVRRLAVRYVQRRERAQAHRARLQDKRKSLRDLLDQREIDLDDVQEVRIDECDNVATLSRWHKQANRASTAAEALR